MEIQKSKMRSGESQTLSSDGISSDQSLNTGDCSASKLNIKSKDILRNKTFQIKRTNFVQKRILIVDDEPFNLMGLQNIL